MPRRAGTASRRGLTHLSARGDARMVDVSAKPETAREAIASAILRMSPKTLAIVRAGNAPKGDVLGVARTAGILAAKRTHELIPLCHPLLITKVRLTCEPDDSLPGLRLTAEVKVQGQTGVEMEALTAVSVACLTVYDMLKAADKGLVIDGVRLLSKSGGNYGDWTR